MDHEVAATLKAEAKWPPTELPEAITLNSFPDDVIANVLLQLPQKQRCAVVVEDLN